MEDKKHEKRKANWTEGERLAGIELIVQQADKLFGKFRGASLGAKEKDKCWQAIANELNASGKTTCIRSVAELKKMYYNSKGKAKDKVDGIGKTGGGPAPVLDTCEDVIIQHMMKNNKAQLQGISGGIDSDKGCPEEVISIDGYNLQDVVNIGDKVISTYVEVQEDKDVIESGATNQCLCESSSSTLDLNSITEKRSSHNKQLKRNKRKLEDNEKDLNQMERKRMEKEIEKLDAEISFINQRNCREEELFSLKKNLQNQLNSCNCTMINPDE